MFKLKDKEYDETKLSEKGKLSLQQIHNINIKQSQMNVEYENLNVLKQHWTKILEEEVSTEEEKKE